MRLADIRRGMILSLLWMAGSCAINDRKGPNLPSESKNSGRTSDATGVTSGTQRLGQQLYARYCENCHNPLAKSNRRGSSTDEILRAIAKVEEMADLDRLKVSELYAIAEALRR